MNVKNKLGAALSILITVLIAGPTLEVYAQEVTGEGVLASRHKSLYFNVNGCGNLFVTGSGSTEATMGVLNLDGTPRTDGNGDCVPYKLPNSFAFIMTSMTVLTQEVPGAANPCGAIDLLLQSPTISFAVLYKSGGVATRLNGFCSYEANFGSGMALFSPQAELRVRVAANPLINAHIYGYLVKQ